MKVSTQAFAAAIRRVVFAAGDTNSRYALDSVLVDDNGNVVATDARRMAIAQIDVNGGESVLIPRKAAKAFASRVRPSTNGQVEVTQSALQWQGKRKSLELQFDANGSRYPNWKDIVPDETQAESVLSGLASEILACLPNPEAQHGWLLAWSKADCRLTPKEFDLSKVLNLDKGKASNLCCNPQYLRDYLETLPEDSEAYLYVTKAISPVLVVGKLGDAVVSRYVFMPMSSA